MPSQSMKTTKPADRRIARPAPQSRPTVPPLEPTAPGASRSRAASKQSQVIGLLQRPQGATIEEMAIAMGWQRHTVRGMISGALKKELGLEILSEPTDRERLYRIGESRPTLP